MESRPTSEAGGQRSRLANGTVLETLRTVGEVTRVVLQNVLIAFLMWLFCFYALVGFLYVFSHF